MAAALAAACGVATPAAPPSAKEILAKPQQSDLKDAHFKVSGKITNYILTSGSPKWLAVKTSYGIDPTTFAGSNDQKYVGEENLPQGKAWHVTALDKGGYAFDAYIRESDGYPIKYVDTQGGQMITLTFDKYNAGETITAPPADQIQPG